VHLKMDKVDLKKKPPCQKEFFTYFNALETRGD
jgi:hypothetical protein